VRALDCRRLVLGAALVAVACLTAGRAFAYGVYEEQILGAGYVRLPPPLPNLDAPELFSQAFFTPPPVDDDAGLVAIEGTLNPASGDFADMYCILIGGRFDPADFTAKMVAPFNPNGLTPSDMIADPQLFLFDAMGHPIVGNDDTDDLDPQPTIPAGTITQAGVYILAISGKGYVPTDEALSELFTDVPQGLKTPTDPFGVQAAWSGTHAQSGRYRIDFHDAQGAITVEHWVPEPNTFGLLLAGLSGLALQRKCRSRPRARPLGARALEGKGEPVEVYRVLGRA
jgi:hypothetical protein